MALKTLTALEMENVFANSTLVQMLADVKVMDDYAIKMLREPSSFDVLKVLSCSNL